MLNRRGAIFSFLGALVSPIVARAFPAPPSAPVVTRIVATIPTPETLSDVLSRIVPEDTPIYSIAARPSYALPDDQGLVEWEWPYESAHWGNPKYWDDHKSV